MAMESALSVSNPNIDTRTLPEDQQVSLLNEARKYYNDSNPPFASKNVGKNAYGTIKRIVLAAENGKYPQLPVTVECVHRRWNKNWTFATVDLNGKRRIVKSRSGGPNGGASYILWRGVEKGFAEKPVGFTEKDTSILRQITPTDSTESGSPPRKKIFRASRPIVGHQYDCTPMDVDQDQPHVTIASSSDERSSSEEDGINSEDPMKHDRCSTPMSANWSFPPKDRKSNTSSPATPMIPVRMSYERPRKHSTAKNEKANQFLMEKMRQGCTISTIREIWKALTGLETTEAAWRSRYWRLNAKGMTGTYDFHTGRNIQTPEEESDMFDPVRGIRFRAVNSRYTPGTSPYFRRPSRSTPLSIKDTARQASEPSTRESIESPALANAEAGAQSSSTIYQQLMTPLTTPTESSSTIFSLSPQKLARTTLRIADSKTFTPLKLRSCSNISALFAKVLDICGLTTSKDTVEALKLTFDWFPDDAEERTMLLKERYEDSFEFFLETVDEAPCWGEGGKCNVGVQVVVQKVVADENEGDGELVEDDEVTEGLIEKDDEVAESLIEKDDEVAESLIEDDEVVEKLIEDHGSGEKSSEHHDRGLKRRFSAMEQEASQEAYCETLTTNSEMQ